MIRSIGDIRLELLALARGAEEARTQDAHDLDRHVNAEAVHRALERLSLPHQEVLTLFFLEEWPVERIAEVIDAPPGTVKSRLHYAKQALRKILEEKE